MKVPEGLRLLFYSSRGIVDSMYGDACFLGLGTSMVAKVVGKQLSDIV